MYSDLLNVLRAKANRKAPNNVIWSECLRVIEELMAENLRLKDQIVGEIETTACELQECEGGK